MQVENMKSSNGNSIPTQSIIQADNGLYFQSYSSVIAFKPHGGNLILDTAKWDYSRTTAKYRNQFTGLTTKETKAKIKSGEIILQDLN